MNEALEALASGSRLSNEQLAAVNLLLIGESVTKTAEAIGVSRQTIYEWKWHRPALDEMNPQGCTMRDLWRAIARKQIAQCCADPSIAHLAWISYRMFIVSCRS